MQTFIDFKEEDVLKAAERFKKKLSKSSGGPGLAMVDVARLRVLKPTAEDDKAERILYVCCEDIFDSTALKIVRTPMPNIDWRITKWSSKMEVVPYWSSAWRADVSWQVGNLPVEVPRWCRAKNNLKVTEEEAEIRVRLIARVNVEEFDLRWRREKRCKLSDDVIAKNVNFYVRERIGKSYDKGREAHVDWFGPLSEIEFKRHVYDTTVELLRQYGECKNDYDYKC